MIRRVVRRLVLAQPDQAEKAAADRPSLRLGHALERPVVPPLWRPGAMPWSPWAGNLERLVLGDRGLDAAAHWPGWAKELTAAEDEMLGLIAARAELEPGQRTLVVSDRRGAVASYLVQEVGLDPIVWTPDRDRAAEIEAECQRRGVPEVEVCSGRLGEAVAEAAFDRILAIESLPADADPRTLLADLGARLRPGGRLFLQLACHRRYAYSLSRAESRWLGLEEGALVPAADLAPHLAPNLVLHQHWELSGEHYERTARAWRRRLEERRTELLEAAIPTLGESAARDALDNWRLSLQAREEMFGLRGGQEWWISHYALDRPRS